MPLSGRARLKGVVHDFDYYDWWKSLVKLGISPKEAWQLDFIESSHLLDIELPNTDTTLALYHTRKHNGAPDKWLIQNH